jgi:hypothetical protein
MDLTTCPSVASIVFLESLVDDKDSFDLSMILRDFHKHIRWEQNSRSYYKIIEQFCIVPRSALREIKIRYLMTLEAARAGSSIDPLRVVCPESSCTFVFMVPPNEINSMKQEDVQARINGLKNLTLGAKYDQKTERAVGIMITKDGRFYDIDWCFIEHPWEYDIEIEKKLEVSYPFLPVREAQLSGYRFKADHHK